MDDGPNDSSDEGAGGAVPSETPEEKARRARAQRLREELARIRSEEDPVAAESGGDESPREFVERRMRELEDVPDEDEAGPDP